MYDPTVGRWLSQDPLGFEAGDANLYRYVHNDPVNRTDPSGRQDAPRRGVAEGAHDAAALAALENYGGPDVSDWFMREIDIFRREARRVREQLAANQVTANRSDDCGGAAFGQLVGNGLELRAEFARLGRLMDYKMRPSFTAPGIRQHDGRTVTLFGKVVKLSQLGNIMYGIIAADMGLVDEARQYGRGNPSWLARCAGATGPNPPWTAPGQAHRESAFDVGVNFANGAQTPARLRGLMDVPVEAVDTGFQHRIPSTIVYNGEQTDLTRRPLVNAAGNRPNE